jgi:hypothetical protein
LSHLDSLTALQRDLLRGFFARERRFFLTGGAALVGFHLGHRTTHDLDLFSAAFILDEGEAVLVAVAEDLGATIESVTTAPGFRRRLVRRGPETVIVDLVREQAHQGRPDKPEIDGIRVDPPEEILANKLCTLLSRAEIRDLVDVRALELAGYPLEPALRLAAQKDTGLTPAQLAWVLSQIEIGEGAELPGEVLPGELRRYLEDLVSRLTRRAWPDQPR